MRRETTELLQRVNHAGISPRRARPRPAAGRPADRVDRPVPLARRPPPDHGRAVGDPGRQRDRHPVRRRPPAGVRRRRRRLHLPPSRRDQPDRRPCHRAERRGDRRLRAARDHERRRPGDADGRAEARAAVPRAPDRRRRRRPRRSRAAPSARREGGDVRAARAARCSASPGWSGSGRSELLRAVYGVDRRDAGEVLVDGVPLPSGRPDKAIAAGLGLAPEDRKSQALLLEWSLTKNVTLTDVARFQRGAAQRAGASVRPRRSSCARCTPRPSDGERLARDLSGGNQQKVVLARWLLHECRVLLLDEPTRGVDVATKAELFRIIADLAGARPRRGRRLVGDRGAAAACARGSSSCAKASWWPSSTARRQRARRPALRDAGDPADGDGRRGGLDEQDDARRPARGRSDTGRARSRCPAASGSRSTPSSR